MTYSWSFNFPFETKWNVKVHTFKRFASSFVRFLLFLPLVLPKIILLTLRNLKFKGPFSLVCLLLYTIRYHTREHSYVLNVLIVVVGLKCSLGPLPLSFFIWCFISLLLFSLFSESAKSFLREKMIPVKWIALEKFEFCSSLLSSLSLSLSHSLTLFKTTHKWLDSTSNIKQLFLAV